MHYSGWKVAILGFGLEGQDAARYFLGQKSIITVFDKKEEKEIVTSAWRDKPIAWKTGEGYLKNGLKDFDLIVRSPGFYRFMPEIVQAEKSGVKATSNTNLFFEESEANIIAITGTKGKGTTAKMLELGLKAAGKTALVLGNIGEPMLDHIPDADTFDWVILELSSFQTIDLRYSPKIAVVTNITLEHLNWHKDRAEYVQAKEMLWRHQRKYDFVVFNADDQTSQKLAKQAPGQIVWFSTKTKAVKGTYIDENKVILNLEQRIDVGSKTDLKVPGEHMLSDALAALLGAAVADADSKLAWKGIASYKGAPHRMEEVARVDGVLFINDSFATTPEAAIAAMQAFPNPKIVILGGSSKNIPLNSLGQAAVENNVKAVLLLGQTQDEIEKILGSSGFKGIVKKGFTKIEDIVREAKDLAKSGDVVLLSPACASFGLFTDYKDRGKKFKEAVLKLKN